MYTPKKHKFFVVRKSIGVLSKTFVVSIKHEVRKVAPEIALLTISFSYMACQSFSNKKMQKAKLREETT